MKKISPTVLKETLYIFSFTIILSVLMESVFLIINKWDIAVLLGNLLGIAAATVNFFLMGLTVQSALEKEEKEAKNLLRLSQMLRMLFLFAIAVAGYFGFKAGVFNLIAVIIPYIFPRIAVALRPFIGQNKEGGSNE